MATKTPSHHLKNKEFQIVRLLHAPQDGVVGALLPYSQINHKIYYRTEDVEVFVESMSREIMEDE